jgi:hypothetical protein
LLEEKNESSFEYDARFGGWRFGLPAKFVCTASCGKRASVREVVIENVKVQDNVVSGELYNRSPHPVREVADPSCLDVEQWPGSPRSSLNKTRKKPQHN